MSSDNFNLDEINEERRKGLLATIRTISIDEMKALGEGLFPFVDHPWREKFFGFIAENSGATFHHASTADQIHIIYCSAKDRGMWFLPGSGMGPLQARGLKIMKELAAGVM